MTRSSSSVIRTRFICTRCGATFNSNDDCHRHVDEKHNGRRREACTFCSKVVLKRSIKRHLKRCRRARPSMDLYFHSNAAIFIPWTQSAEGHEYYRAGHISGPDPRSVIVYDRVIMQINERNGWGREEVIQALKL